MRPIRRLFTRRLHRTPRFSHSYRPAESGTTSAGLYGVALDSCTPFIRGGIPELRFSRILGKLTTLPDPWSGQQCAWWNWAGLGTPFLRSGYDHPSFPKAALTIATMPALIASGRVGHARRLRPNGKASFLLRSSSHLGQWSRQRQVPPTPSLPATWCGFPFASPNRREPPLQGARFLRSRTW